MNAEEPQGQLQAEAMALDLQAKKSRQEFIEKMRLEQKPVVQKQESRPVVV
jgi:hypothetical protein